MLSVVIPQSPIDLTDSCYRLSTLSFDITASNPDGAGATKLGAFTYFQILESFAVAQPLGVGSDECPSGGWVLYTGKDTNKNGALDISVGTNEATSVSYICDGIQTLVEVTDGAPTCAEDGLGGVTVCHGTDLNVDGVLVESEILPGDCMEICDGRQGEPGEQGIQGEPGTAGANAAVVVTDDIPEDQCNGGTGLMIESGTIGEDGTIDSPDYSYICDGENGQAAVVEVSEFDAANPEGNCSNGGTKVLAGYETNGVPDLQPIEVDGVAADTNVTMTYLCQPLPSRNSLIESEVIDPAEGGVCGLAGGIQLTIGLDTNGDGSLFGEPNLIPRTICNGLPGQDGIIGSDGIDGEDDGDQQ